MADDTEGWRRTLHEHGLLAVAWPREYGGGGLTKREQVVLAEEFARAGVPTGAPQDNFGIKMVGAVGLFSITFLLALPVEKLRGMQRHRAFWSALNIVCALTILIGAALMRTVAKRPL